jgi:hypothetical protein
MLPANEKRKWKTSSYWKPSLESARQRKCCNTGIGECGRSKGIWQLGTYLPLAEPHTRPVENGSFEREGKTKNTKIQLHAVPKNI